MNASLGMLARACSKVNAWLPTRAITVSLPGAFGSVQAKTTKITQKETT
jgi:hypothetical protein